MHFKVFEILFTYERGLISFDHNLHVIKSWEEKYSFLRELHFISFTFHRSSKSLSFRSISSCFDLHFVFVSAFLLFSVYLLYIILFYHIILDMLVKDRYALLLLILLVYISNNFKIEKEME